MTPQTQDTRPETAMNVRLRRKTCLSPMLASTSAANPCLVKNIGRPEYVRVIATDIVQAKVRMVVRLLNHDEKKPIRYWIERLAGGVAAFASVGAVGKNGYASVCCGTGSIISLTKPIWC